MAVGQFLHKGECTIVQFHLLCLTKMSLALSTSSKYLKGSALCTAPSLRLRYTPNAELFDLETFTQVSNEAEIAHIGPTSSISLLSKNFTRSKRRLAGKRVESLRRRSMNIVNHIQIFPTHFMHI